MTTFMKLCQIFITASTHDTMTYRKVSWFSDFVFYTILKQLDHKFAVMFRKYGVQKFRSVPKIGRNLC
jgi:hypothetical protein